MPENDAKSRCSFCYSVFLVCHLLVVTDGKEMVGAAEFEFAAPAPKVADWGRLVISSKVGIEQLVVLSYVTLERSALGAAFGPD